MPSSATITAFYSFTANSRARASQVNANFSIFRGHILPVDPNTQTSVNNTYDLGSPEYYFRIGYFGSIDLITSTSTATLTISGDVAATGGAFDFKIEGTSAGKVYPGGYVGPSQGATSTAGIGQIGKSAALSAISAFNTSGSMLIANSTLVVTTIGRPVEIKGFPIFGQSGTAGKILSTYSPFYIWLVRNGVTLTANEMDMAANHYYSPSALNFIDLSAPAGVNTYSLTVKVPFGATATGDVRIGDLFLIGKEI